MHEFTTAVVIGRNVEVAGMLRPFKNRTSVHRPATLRLHQLACTSMPPRKVSPSVSLLYPPTFCRPAPLRCFHLCLDSSPAPPSRCCSGQTAWTRTGALLPIAGQCDVERCVHRPGEAGAKSRRWTTTTSSRLCTSCGPPPHRRRRIFQVKHLYGSCILTPLFCFGPVKLMRDSNASAFLTRRVHITRAH